MGRAPLLDPGWVDGPEAGSRDREAVAALAEVFPESGPNLWKDPRHCLLLPYWRRFLGGPVAAVFIWRSPAAVAGSLRARDGIPSEVGVALWEWYNRQALTGLGGLPVYALRNETLVDDPLGTCTALADWLSGLGITPSGATGWDVGAAAAVVAPQLDHHRDVAGADLLPGQVALVDQLVELEGAHAALDSDPGRLSPWSDALLAERRRGLLEVRTEWQAHQELSGSHQALVTAHLELIDSVDRQEGRARALQGRIDDLSAEVAHLREQLEERTRERDELQDRADRAGNELERVRGSTSWKVTAPLRALVDPSRRQPPSGR